MYQMLIKLTEEEKQKIDFLCNTFGESKSGFIRSIINAQYDNLIGNPELAKMIEQMQELGRSVEIMTGRALPDNSEKP